jgi:hypothetical protein
MILIDDEADNASINVAKGTEAVSRINGQIRALLNLFSKSSYVAFTARPFANIFIDPDLQHEEAGRDLFPEHFLIAVDRPGNYYGAEKVLLGEPDEEAGRPKRDIEDNEPHLPLKMPKGQQVRDLPESLMTAIRTFIVSGAIRHLRGQRDKHHSMLVNVSHLTSVQAGPVTGLCRSFDHVSCRKGEHRCEFDVIVLHRAFDSYRVRDGFPRIVPAAFPDGPVEVAYDLPLTDLSAFHMSERNFNDLLACKG